MDTQPRPVKDEKLYSIPRLQRVSQSFNFQESLQYFFDESVYGSVPFKYA